MQQIIAKRVQDNTRLGGEGNPLGILQEIEIWSNKQMVYVQSRIRYGEWDAQTSLGFSNINRSANLGQTTRPDYSKKKKKKKKKTAK